MPEEVISEYLWSPEWRRIGHYGIMYRFYPMEECNYFDLSVPAENGGRMSDCVPLLGEGSGLLPDSHYRTKLFRRVYSWEKFLERNGMVVAVLG